MSSDIAISAHNLTKTYRIFGHPGDRIKQAASFGFKRYHKEFTALKDVSFDIKKGEAVGIIGRNGSGKSTLLQLICGILKPTHGTVQANGRISALLELGAGFNPEFTGRENVYFQGAIMGFPEDEMRTRISDIAAFADIGEFFDQPVRTYSSGMYVRLAFSVAIHVDPDILIVDEALAVGDMEFQAKCMSAFLRFRTQGVTILFVSHDINTIKSLCNSALYLKKGQLCQTGRASEVAGFYVREMHATRHGRGMAELGKTDTFFANDGPFRANPDFARRAEAFRQGSGEARITEVEFLDETGRPLVEAEFGQHATVRLHIQFNAKCEISVSYYMRDDKHLLLTGSSTLLEGLGMLTGVRGSRKVVQFDTELPLTDGHYNILVQLSTPIILNQSAHFVDYVENAVVFTVQQHHPIKIFSKLYIKNTVSVTDGNRK